MGSLLWAGRLEESPYQHLLSVDLWGQLRESLVVDGSRVSGLSRESVLAVAFRVGEWRYLSASVEAYFVPYRRTLFRETLT